jgi:fibronectin-binding autotransporter adhesin
MFRKTTMRGLMAAVTTLILALSVSSVAKAQLVLTLTNAGVGSVTIPAGYEWTNVTVQCWSGGGGGAGGLGAAGGGGGAYASKTYSLLTAAIYNCYIGGGGGGGLGNDASGGNGGSTIWNYGGSQDILVTGGGGGYFLGTGGSAGQVVAGNGYNGGTGGNGYYNGVGGTGGGGGGSGGPSVAGGNGGNGTAAGGGGGGSGFGPGGIGGNNSSGSNGSVPGGGGGGGGGSDIYNGSTGGNGEIVLTYTPLYFGAQPTWSASGGGTWGTLTSNFGTNWGGAGYPSPGLNPSSPDRATLSSSVPSGTAVVTLDGASPNLAALTFSNSAANYVIASGSGGTLQLNGGTVAVAVTVTDSAGSHAISVPVALVSNTVMTVANSSNTLTISGPISGSGGLTTGGVGEVVLTANNTYSGGTTISAGTLSLGNGGMTGSVAGSITNNATLLFSLAGNQPFANSVSGSGNVVVSGPGTVTLQVPLSPTQTAVNQGQLVIASGASLSGNVVIGSSGHCTNNGDMSNIVNMTNAGIFSGNAQISGNFYNSPSGDVRVIGGQTLFLQSANPQSNAGLIEAIGTSAYQAGFESAGPFTNASGGGSGLIASQNATFHFDSGLTNQAAIAFSNGVNNVFGAVANTASGNITVAGGASVTFWGDVAQNGTLVVASAGNTHSSAVFLGAFSGSGGFTGGGDVFIEGDLRPSDPVTVSFGGNTYLANSTNTVMQLEGTTAGSGYDQINVTGQLVLAGSLDVELIGGFQPQAGETFQLFTGNLSGAFSELSLPALSNGLSWNTSNLDASGSVSVVPEPSTFSLLIVGTVGLLVIVSRHKRNFRTSYGDAKNSTIDVALKAMCSTRDGASRCVRW